MILWTIQHISAFDKMKITGVLRANEKYIDSDFKKSYNWIAKQMSKRIGKPPKSVKYPVWAWYQFEGKRKRPDMRFHARHWAEKGTPIVLMTIDVPDKLVLLSDFDYWNVVLSNGEIIFPFDESAVYSQKEKEKSWENIFDITCSFTGEEKHKSITTQATIWEIKNEWVKKVEYFICR